MVAMIQPHLVVGVLRLKWLSNALVSEFRAKYLLIYEVGDGVQRE